ncbi:unnamed protein product [Enterobius vermicularis]|uniref:DNA_MISMATCH_REPAIR_2 domain-containing protein n=1 Tax=Enterobius vermicularis TaxID=51028 RepID=A0A0N4UXS6_ENTVE|nr:unnamed protein product [Enterobius vermicularis]
MSFNLLILAPFNVRAFGALLKYLDAVRLGVEFEDYSVKTPVVSVEVFSMSLCCRRWFESPTVNRKTLSIRQKAISFFIQDCNVDSLNFIATRVKNIGSLKVSWHFYFQESNLENKVVMNRGVSNELDKRILIKTFIDVDACSVVYVPMFGYLLELPAETDVSFHNDLQLIYELPEERMKHYKSSRMHQLDQQIGDIKMEISDIETTTMLRFKIMTYSKSNNKNSTIHRSAELECCISLALAACEYDWHRPLLVDEPVIDVDKARHPLAELLSIKKFVPNPIRSGCAQTKVKLIIGPNASGKSVYLKQVGLIVFLAHIGSFVPAERAVIGPIDRILTRLYTVDCVADGLSSFAKDIAQMASCLRRSTGQSLIIIDEFGKGTLTEVGVSLLAASLNSWIDRGKSLCPHVFVSSHFHSLMNFLHQDSTILSYHVIYILVDGIIDCSYAIYTAEAAGIPESVIKRSLEVRMVEILLVNNI